MAIADSGMMAEHVVPAAATRAVDQSLRQVVVVLLFPGVTAVAWINIDVLPHVILLPGASPRMLPVARPEGCEATYGLAPGS